MQYFGYQARYTEGINTDQLMTAILFKAFIILLLLLILASLAAGVIFLVKDDSDANSKRLVTSLTVRISLSILLFVSLFVGYYFGLIQPHGLGQ